MKGHRLLLGVSLAALLLWGGMERASSPQEAHDDDPVAPRLDRLERKLDQLLEADRSSPEGPQGPSAVTPRPPRGRKPSAPGRQRRRELPPPAPRFQSIELPPEAPPPPPPAVAPKGPRGWTWAEIDAWRALMREINTD